MPLQLTSMTAPSQDWQQQFREAVRDPVELCRKLELPDEYLAGATLAAKNFRVFAPQSYIQRMQPGNPHDPLLRQVLPQRAELDETPGFSLDPVGDNTARIQPGLIQKYQGRVLMITTGMCAIHCRYCFRRHYPYEDEPRSFDAWGPALNQIEADRSLQEVILSGGDPLTLSDQRIGRLIAQLGRFDHIKRLRIHTRLPIVIPDRVTEELIANLTEHSMLPYLVIHANHANELDASVLQQIRRLRQAGVVLLNQSVLLRGVNDSVAQLTELSQVLCDHGVLPYYLNQLDKVAGASHFEVDIRQGEQLILELRKRLPGYAVPRYVQEIAGEPHKTVLL